MVGHNANLAVERSRQDCSIGPCFGVSHFLCRVLKTLAGSNGSEGGGIVNCGVRCFSAPSPTTSIKKWVAFAKFFPNRRGDTLVPRCYVPIFVFHHVLKVRLQSDEAPKCCQRLLNVTTAYPQDNALPRMNFMYTLYEFLENGDTSNASDAYYIEMVRS